MKIYITTLDKEILRNYFLNFRSYSFIDVREIVKEETRSGFYDNPYVNFLVEQRICAEIQKAKKKRSMFDVIYCCDNIDKIIIENVKSEFRDCEIDSVIYIEDKSKSDVDVGLFDSVLHSPVKRKRISKCGDIKEMLD